MSLPIATISSRSGLRGLVVIWVLLAQAQAHGGGTITGTITGTVAVTRPAGVEPGPVLVYVVGFAEAPPDEPVEIQQRSKHFIPDLAGITAGQSIRFPNGDPFLHNVFSPTDARRFDLGSYQNGQSRSRKFPDPGVIDVYCNIHPEMSATIVVLPNRRHTIAKADGTFVIEGVPPGSWQVFAYSRRSAKPVSVAIAVAPNTTAEIKLQLDEIQRTFKHENKFGEKYRIGDEYRPSH